MVAILSKAGFVAMRPISGAGPGFLEGGLKVLGFVLLILSMFPLERLSLHIAETARKSELSYKNSCVYLLLVTICAPPIIIDS